MTHRCLEFGFSPNSWGGGVGVGVSKWSLSTAYSSSIAGRSSGLCPHLFGSKRNPAAVVPCPSLGLAPPFFGAVLTFYSPGNNVLNIATLNSFKANTPSSSSVNSSPQLPSLNALTSPQVPPSKLALSFLCQTPPKSFTNVSKFLVSCAHVEVS